MKYRVYCVHTEYYSNIVEADSVDEAKSIVDDFDLDSLSFESADFEITEVKEIDNA